MPITNHYRPGAGAPSGGEAPDPRHPEGGASGAASSGGTTDGETRAVV